MSIMIDALLTGWDRNLDYARKLLADVPAEKLADQPVPEINHPAWTFSHISAYHDVMVRLVTGQKLAVDPKDQPFGMLTKPVADLSVYPPKTQLLDNFVRGHEAVSAALRRADPAALEAPIPLERWHKAFGKVGVALAYLMLVHESQHLGQVSVWRRVQGLPRV
jgi:hypothetical protein